MKKIIVIVIHRKCIHLGISRLINIKNIHPAKGRGYVRDTAEDTTETFLVSFDPWDL